MADSNSVARAAVLNTKELGKLASNLLDEVRKQRDEHNAKVITTGHQADELLKVAMKLAASHSGSNFGYHGALYYGDFDAPPIGGMFSIEWGGIHGIPPGWKK